jgi:hypothetical protein
VLLLLLAGLCVPGAATQAQGLMSGMSPWTGLGVPMVSPSQFPSLPYGSGTTATMPGLSPWAGIGSPMMAPSLVPSVPYGYGTGTALSGMSPWSGLGSSMMAPSPASSLPYGYGTMMPGQLVAPYLEQAYGGLGRSSQVGSWQAPSPAHTDSQVPDMTGSWRGSGGETVEIQRNRARIWGGGQQSCSCVFFLVGQRLIAYSPDSDTVRKYWYQGQGDRFSLVDEQGNLMSFWRVR